MPTKRLSFRSFMRGLWLNGPRENVPEQALRRAKAIYPLRGGSVLSRSPMTVLCTQDAHSLFRFNNHRLAGVGNAVLVDCISATAPTQNGQPLSWMELSAQFLSTQPLRSKITDLLFVSGGSKPFKFDTSFNATNWGIFPPTKTMLDNITATKVPPTSTVFEALDSVAGSGRFAVNKPEDNSEEIDISANCGVGPPAICVDAVRTIDGGGSIRFQVQKDQSCIFRKPVTADLSAGSVDDDYITFWIRCNKPKHIQNIDVNIYVGPGPFSVTTPGNDFYHHEIQIKRVNKRTKKSLKALGDIVPDRDVRRFLKDNAPGTVTDWTFQQFNDAEFTSVDVVKNAWTHVTIPKKLFIANSAGPNIGSAGYTFANVIGIEFKVETQLLTAGAKVWFDSMALATGVGTSGDYLWTFTFLNDNTGARSLPPLDQDGNIITKALQGLDRHSVTFGNLNAGNTFSAADIPGFPTNPDPQVTHFELWRTIGNGGLTFFWAGKFTIGTASITDNRSDYVGMMTGTQNVLEGGTVLTIDNAPMGAAFRDNYLSFQPSPPAFNPASAQNTTDYVMQAVYHPPTGRVFALSHDFPSRVMYSAPGRPESLASFIEPSTPDDPVQRLIEWSNNLFVFTQKHVFEIVNTDEPFVAVEINGAPGTTQPFTVRPTPMGPMYFSKDGTRLIEAGQASILFGQDQLAPIFRGSTVDNNAGAPFVATVAEYGRSEAYFSDGATTTYAFDFNRNSWRNVGTAAKAFFYEQDTGVLQATAIGCTDFGAQIMGAGPVDLSTLDGTHKYMAMTSTPPVAGLTTLAIAQSTLTKSITLTRLAVQLQNPVPVLKTLTLQYNIEGATQGGIVLTLIPGQTTGVATGSVTYTSGQRICVECTAAGFAGTVLSFSGSYIADTNTMLHLRQYGVDNAARTSSLFGVAADSFGPPVAAVPDSWSSQNVQIVATGTHVDVAPGIGNGWSGDIHSFFYQQTMTLCVPLGLLNWANVFDVHGGYSVLGAATDNVTPQAFPPLLIPTATPLNIPVGCVLQPGGIPAFDVSQSYAVVSTFAGAPTPRTALSVCWEYTALNDPTVQIIGLSIPPVHLSTASLLFAGGFRFGVSGTEATQQLVMSAPGTFILFNMRYQSNGDVDLYLRVNGVDQAHMAIPSLPTDGFGGGTFSVPVAAGDLVSLRMKAATLPDVLFFFYGELWFRPMAV